MGAMCAYVSVCLPVRMHTCVCVCVCMGGLGECHRVSDLDATHTLRSTLTGCIIESGLVCECVSVCVIHSTGSYYWHRKGPSCYSLLHFYGLEG